VYQVSILGILPLGLTWVSSTVVAILSGTGIEPKRAKDSCWAVEKQCKGRSYGNSVMIRPRIPGRLARNKPCCWDGAEILGQSCGCERTKRPTWSWLSRPYSVVHFLFLLFHGRCGFPEQHILRANVVQDYGGTDEYRRDVFASVQRLLSALSKCPSHSKQVSSEIVALLTMSCGSLVRTGLASIVQTSMLLRTDPILTDVVSMK
jgi:hypothetical protein